MVLYGLIRTVRDPLSGYVVQGIAHNDYELSVLVNQLIEKLRQDFGSNYDISHIAIS